MKSLEAENEKLHHSNAQSQEELETTRRAYCGDRQKWYDKNRKLSDEIEALADGRSATPINSNSSVAADTDDQVWNIYRRSFHAMYVG